MPRPCEAEHPTACPDDCRVCWLYERDPRYRTLWGGDSVVPTDAIQIVMTANGIGDAVLGLTAATGLARHSLSHQVYYVVTPAVSRWCTLFSGYGRLLVSPLDRVPHLLPCTAAAEHCRDRPRWVHYAEVCGTTPVLPDVALLLPGTDTWAERYRGCVVLSPWTATIGSRRWPVDSWKRLAFRLVSAGIRTIVIDQAGEEERNSVFGDVLLGLPPARVAALMQAASCVVSNDSGMAHVAGMLRRPVVVLNEHYNGDHIYGIYPAARNIQGRLGDLPVGRVLHAIQPLQSGGRP